jgi:tight adherence protein C
VSAQVSGVLLGLLAGCGLVMVLYYAPPMRRLTLEQRIEPYLRDSPVAARRRLEVATPTGPLAPVMAFLGPTLAKLATRLDRFMGGRPALERRLERSGAVMSVERYRLQQLAWAVSGAIPGALLLASTLAGGSGPSAGVGLALLVAGVAGGAVARDSQLTGAVAKREEAILDEFPTVAELLALSVTAGEGPAAGLARVGASSDGPLAGELRRALADVNTGMTLSRALEALARRIGLDPIDRFVDGLLVAMERGSPLGEVLRAQAVDAREARKRQLLESGGRKEIAMMVPVVFLVLPTTIIFALYPGIVGFGVVAG